MKTTGNYTFSLIKKEAAIGQLKAFKALGIKAYSQYFENLTPENVSTYTNALESDEKWREMLPVATTFACSLGEEIIGMAFLMPQGYPTDIFQADWAYLRLVGVAPEHRGKGIARQLVQLCIDCARQTGEKMLALHSAEIMYPARHVYESLGFKKHKEIGPIYGLQYWLYIMEL